MTRSPRSDRPLRHPRDRQAAGYDQPRCRQPRAPGDRRAPSRPRRHARSDGHRRCWSSSSAPPRASPLPHRRREDLPRAHRLRRRDRHRRRRGPRHRAPPPFPTRSRPVLSRPRPSRPWSGLHEQVPPAFSAIKRGGVTAYVAARRGEALELEARTDRESSARELARRGVRDPVRVGRRARRSRKAPTSARSRATWDARWDCAAHLGALRRTRSARSTSRTRTRWRQLAEPSTTSRLSSPTRSQRSDCPPSGSARRSAARVSRLARCHRRRCHRARRAGT